MSETDQQLPAWKGWTDLIQAQDSLVRQHLHKPRGKFLETAEIVRGLGKLDRTTPAPILEARAQKAYVLAVKAMLDADPLENQKFLDKITLGWLAKLVAATRLRELARVKIVKRGGSGGARYDISDLSATFYGHKILEGLSHDRRRRSLTIEEFAELEKACAKIKLKLPESVEPTTTELFFDAPAPEPKKKRSGAKKKKSKSKTTTQAKDTP
jgi:hypothetical protein